MARIDAFKILISSILVLSTKATPQASASFSITVRSASLCDLFNCLESFKKGWEKSLAKITAAATTGPAKQPRPASSHPTSILSSA